MSYVDENGKAADGWDDLDEIQSFKPIMGKRQVALTIR